MNAPYRITVWGPGGLGAVCIREIVRRPEFELAAVFAFSADKDGKDAGQLAGIGPVGIMATTDIDAAMAVPCECVVHVARDDGNYGSLDQIVRLLESGKNVITIHPFHHLEALAYSSAPEDAGDRLRAAATAGTATFHATGLNPSFVCDKLVPALSGLCSDITSIHVREIFDVTFIPPSIMSLLGYGQHPEAATETPWLPKLAESNSIQNLYGLAAALGVEIDHTALEYDFVPAPCRLEFGELIVEEGTVGRVEQRLLGHVDAAGPDPFIVVEYNWMAGHHEMLPHDADADEHYAIRIEGRPVIRSSLAFSAGAGEQGPTIGDASAEPAYLSTIAAMLQSVPRVCDAEPGVIESISPYPRWLPDFRGLAQAGIQVGTG